MKHIQASHRKPMFLIGLTTFGAAALGVGIVAGLWFRPADGRGWPALLAAAVLALTGSVAIVRLSRARAARRLDHALDIYAEREIARARGRKSPRTAV